MNSRKGFSQIIVVIAVVAALILLGVAIYLYWVKQTSPAPTSYVAPAPNTAVLPVDNTQTPIPTVKSAQDLTTVSNDLDATNIDGMNNTLNQNAADAATF